MHRRNFRKKAESIQKFEIMLTGNADGIDRFMRETGTAKEINVFNNLFSLGQILPEDTCTAAFTVKKMTSKKYVDAHFDEFLSNGLEYKLSGWCENYDFLEKDTDKTISMQTASKLYDFNFRMNKGAVLNAKEKGE